MLGFCGFWVIFAIFVLFVSFEVVLFVRLFD